MLAFTVRKAHLLILLPATVDYQNAKAVEQLELDYEIFSDTHAQIQE